MRRVARKCRRFDTGPRQTEISIMDHLNSARLARTQLPSSKHGTCGRFGSVTIQADTSNRWEFMDT